MSQPLISIIIPVYNQQDAIARTLESVCGQSYKHLQIIVVNDGSRDNSPAICRDFAAHDSRIEIIDKQNEGLQAARHTGLMHAKGDYIQHMDGGDYLTPDCCEKIVAELERNNFPDVLLFSFYYEKDGVLSPAGLYPPHVRTNIDLLRYIWTTQQYNSVWQFVHRRDMRGHELDFSGSLNIGEDLYYTTQLLYHSRSVVVTPMLLYYYVLHEVSMTRSAYTKAHFKSNLLYPHLIDEFMRDKPEYEDLRMELLALKLISYTTQILVGNFDNIEKMCREYNEAFSIYPQLRTTGMIKSVRKLIRLYNIHPLLFRMQVRHYQAKGKIRK